MGDPRGKRPGGGQAGCTDHLGSCLHQGFVGLVERLDVFPQGPLVLHQSFGHGVHALRDGLKFQGRRGTDSVLIGAGRHRLDVIHQAVHGFE